MNVYVVWDSRANAPRASECSGEGEVKVFMTALNAQDYIDYWRDRNFTVDHLSVRPATLSTEVAA